MLIDEVRLWLDALFSRLPGRLGIMARRRWFRARFQSSGRHLVVGTGCDFIAPLSMRFGEGIAIGRGAFFAADGGSISVDASTSFNANVHINASAGGEISIGQSCLIGPGVVMRTAGHVFADPAVPIRSQGHSVGNILIEDDVWIGANAIILGGVKIGNGAIVGAGAVVTRDIPAFAIAVGVPARVKDYRVKQVP